MSAKRKSKAATPAATPAATQPLQPTPAATQPLQPTPAATQPLQPTPAAAVLATLSANAAAANAAYAAAPQPPKLPPSSLPTAQAVARANVAAKAAAGVGVTLHSNGAPIKGLSAAPVPAKLTAKHTQFISAIKGHPGVGNCVKRWHLYRVGQTMLHCKTTPGLVWCDATFYAKCGYLTISQATPAQHAAVVAAVAAGQPALVPMGEAQG